MLDLPTEHDKVQRIVDDWHKICHIDPRHVGIWQAQTPPAWQFRAQRWAEFDKTAPEGCPIKGNVNSHGEKLYHVPWGRDYSKVKMDLSKGKQWFCTESDAEQAGWRLAR